MKQDTEHVGGVERGIAVGGATGLAVIAAVYALLAPTNDIRARIPFLLEMSGGALTIVFLLGFWCVAGVALFVTRGLDRRSLFSALIPSFAYVTLLISGILTRFVPEFESSRRAAAAMGLCIVLGGIVIVHQVSFRKRESSSASGSSHVDH